MSYSAERKRSSTGVIGSGARMRIALAGDDGYARHIGALLCSLFENQSGRYRIDVFLLSRRISARNCGHLITICERYGSQLTVCPVAADVFCNAPVPAHYSPVNYFRLLLPALVDPAVDRVLYLDGDMIVLGPLDEAWEADIADVAVGAVADGKRLPADAPAAVPQDGASFNSGFLLLNLDYWRRHGVMEQLFAFIGEQGARGVMRYVDQDALNAVLGNRWRPLPLKFNVQPSAFVPDRRTVFSEAEKAASRQAPIVIHFCGPRKPWHLRSAHPENRAYWRYARLTPWNGLGYSDFTIDAWARRDFGKIVSRTSSPALYRIIQRAYHRVSRRR
jgi:lipopolysaccharide biosynthesis glycosyltransferase